MPKRFFVFALNVLFLSGCAAAGRNHALDLQQCRSRIGFLENELKEREEDIAGLEYELSTKESGIYGRSGAAKKTSIGVGSVSNPSPILVQKTLKSAGYYKGPIDGKIGAKTQEAVIQFQKDNSLKADGKVGPMTWSELRLYLE